MNPEPDGDLNSALGKWNVGLGDFGDTGAKDKPAVYWSSTEPEPVEDPRPVGRDGKPISGPMPLHIPLVDRPVGRDGKPVSGPMPYQPASWEEKPASDAKLDILLWSDAEQEALGARLVAAGVLGEDYKLGDLRAAWEKMVDDASDYHAVGKKLTPWDMIGLTLTGGTSSHTTIQRQSSLSDAYEARRVLNTALGLSLGRRPSETEVDDFQAALNDAQRANPVVTTTAYGGTAAASTASATSTGGVDIGGFAEKYATTGDNTEEYKHYQAATTYMDALKGILGPTVS